MYLFACLLVCLRKSTLLLCLEGGKLMIYIYIAMVMFLWMFLKHWSTLCCRIILVVILLFLKKQPFGSQVPAGKLEIHLRVPCQIQSQTALCFEDQPRTWIRG